MDGQGSSSRRALPEGRGPGGGAGVPAEVTGSRGPSREGPRVPRGGGTACGDAQRYAMGPVGV